MFIIYNIYVVMFFYSYNFDVSTFEMRPLIPTACLLSQPNSTRASSSAPVATETNINISKPKVIIQIIGIIIWKYCNQTKFATFNFVLWFLFIFLTFTHILDYSLVFVGDGRIKLFYNIDWSNPYDQWRILT